MMRLLILRLHLESWLEKKLQAVVKWLIWDTLLLYDKIHRRENMNGTSWEWWINGVKVVITIGLALWATIAPIIQLLLVLMTLDILSGVTAAIVTKTVCSDISFRGIGKKVMVLLLVIMAGILSPLVADGSLPLGQAVALFYCINEAISVTENAGKAGVPLPSFLKDALKKLNPDKPPAP